MANVSEGFLTGSNIDFIELQYARYLKDPTAVERGWAEYFSGLERGGRPLVIDGLELPRPRRDGNGHGAGRTVDPAQAGEAAAAALQSKVAGVVSAFRLRGHLLAELDPLGFPRPPLDQVADVGLISQGHFNEQELDAQVDPMDTFDEPRVPLRRVLERVRRTYAGRIGVEFAHLYNSERRMWLMRRMEHTENTTDFTPAERRRILEMLTRAETFETTIHTKFQAAKRFSGEGGEAMLPMLDAFLELGGSLGLREVVIGMAHRGRLNVLCNILGKPADEIFSEFAGPPDPKAFLNRGDVKYHMGYSSDRETRAGQRIHLSMAFNPSHLGMVYPVVEGRVRAKQDRRGGDEAARHAVCPVVIHGDAAFTGQGLTAETLNLAELEGYTVGGTVHLIINNQIGYTTEAAQGRSSLYCTAPAQLLDIPIFHVNGDDAEACVHVMRLATEYRQRFHSDVVVDLVCYRKYGHNEGDEPAFTQPRMYEVIRAKKTVRALYAEELARKGQETADASEGLLKRIAAEFSDAHARAKSKNGVKDPSHLLGAWTTYRGGPDKDVPQVDTGLPADTLKPLLAALARVPEGFVLHPNIQRGIIEKRQKMVAGEEKLDWGAAEMLAYATLVSRGVRIRITGQDTERGTFAHRQAWLHDQKTGRKAFPLAGLVAEQGVAEILNSPLSEMGCMGFEYGYSLDYPEALVAWEAQFGDFANNGQVMIDQFIASSEDKWKRLTGVTLLLPHGYEGAGPEHSSARLERFLELAAEDNMQVCYPTSAAQIFHLLRRQVLRPIRKPLVVMTPKSLMRLPEATSPWEDFTHGTYRRLIADPQVKPEQATRLILCSGKVYFDLVKARDAAHDAALSIARLEQLYPLPEPELKALLASMPRLQEVLWVQEEPKNSGAWRYMLEPLHELLNPLSAKARLRYVGRPESASPATGFIQTHQYEQHLLVQEAIARGQHAR